MAIDPTNMMDVRTALAAYSTEYAEQGSSAFSGNTDANVESYYDRMAALATDWLNTTNENANYNQMYNDTRYIQTELTDRQQKMGGAVGKARAQVRITRERAAVLDVKAGWYKFVGMVLRYALFCVVVVCVALSLASMGHLSKKTAHIGIGVVVALAVMSAVANSARTASRRDMNWGQFRWRNLKTSE
jgi:hypothetical protein